MNLVLMLLFNTHFLCFAIFRVVGFCWLIFFLIPWAAICLLMMISFAFGPGHNCVGKTLGSHRWPFIFTIWPTSFFGRWFRNFADSSCFDVFGSSLLFFLLWFSLLGVSAFYFLRFYLFFLPIFSHYSLVWVAFSYFLGTRSAGIWYWEGQWCKKIIVHYYSSNTVILCWQVWDGWAWVTRCGDSILWIAWDEHS